MASITDQQLEHLLSFIGYGRLEAETWFLGMEEGGGGEENIRARLDFKPVEDCMNAHEILGIRDWHWDKRKIQRTWRGMCYIMLRMNGVEPTRENIRNYQAEQLGRSNGDTLVCELMPLPKASVDAWGYEKLLPQFLSRRDYYKKIKPIRIQLLRKLTAESQPRRIIAYGKSFWPEYIEIFKDFQFHKTGQFLKANHHHTQILLTDHFTARTMNHKLDEVVDLLK